MEGQDQVARIQQKLNLLLGRFDQLQKENTALRQKLENAHEKEAIARQQLLNLEQTLAVLRLSPGKLDEDSRKALDKKLGHFLKEIDRCIALIEQ